VKEALRSAGLDPRRFSPGDVWSVEDREVRLDDRAGAAPRRYHASRTMVVLDGPERCSDGSLASILAAPTSTRHDLASRYQVVVPDGEGGLSRCVVMLDLIQPVPRLSFKSKFGTVSPEQLDALRAILLLNLGILADTEESPSTMPDEDELPF
jgi:mRNA-degrading endonuclease toxin of MazEF toxin-antitoxin module